MRDLEGYKVRIKISIDNFNIYYLRKHVINYLI